MTTSSLGYKFQVIVQDLQIGYIYNEQTFKTKAYVKKNFPEQFKYMEKHINCVGTHNNYHISTLLICRIIITDLSKWNVIMNKPTRIIYDNYPK